MKVILIAFVSFYQLISITNAQEGTLHPETIIKSQRLSAGIDTVCMIDKKSVKCNGAQTSLILKNLPKQFIEPTSISVSRNHACAVDNGKVTCWGEKSKATKTPNLLLSINDATSIVTSEEITCATTRSHGLKCWGGDKMWYLELMLKASKSIKELTMGSNNVCIISDQEINCIGQVREALPVTGDYVSSPIKNLLNPRNLIVGRNHLCVESANFIKCWGVIQSFDSLGSPEFTEIESPPSVSLTALSAGPNSDCGLTENQEILCWNNRRYDQTRVPMDILRADEVASGEYVSCARVGSKLHCWGDPERNHLPEVVTEPVWNLRLNNQELPATTEKCLNISGSYDFSGWWDQTYDLPIMQTGCSSIEGLDMLLVGPTRQSVITDGVVHSYTGDNFEYQQPQKYFSLAYEDRIIYQKRNDKGYLEQVTLSLNSDGDLVRTKRNLDFNEKENITILPRVDERPIKIIVPDDFLIIADNAYAAEDANGNIYAIGVPKKIGSVQKNGLLLLRYTSDRAPDMSFNNGLPLNLEFDSSMDGEINRPFIKWINNQVFVATEVGETFNKNLLLAKLDNNGKFDSRFGLGGFTVLSVGDHPMHIGINNITQRSSGTLIINGKVTNRISDDFSNFTLITDENGKI